LLGFFAPGCIWEAYALTLSGSKVGDRGHWFLPGGEEQPERLGQEPEKRNEKNGMRMRMRDRMEMSHKQVYFILLCGKHLVGVNSFLFFFDWRMVSMVVSVLVF
jgi:hypothetical protein